MTTPQPDALPELPEGVTLEDLLIPLRSALNTCHDSDWTLRQFKTHITHALAALAALQSQPAAAGVSDAEIDRICYLATEIRFAKTDDAAQAVIDQIRAILALRPQSYPLPDDLYDSKDWRQGNYASRVEWLHTMYEHAKHERDEYAAQLEALRPQAGEVDERAADGYGSTDLPWSFTVCRELEPQEKRLMSMLVSAFGSSHPAIDDMAHLILNRPASLPAAQQATPEDVLAILDECRNALMECDRDGDYALIERIDALAAAQAKGGEA